MRNCYLLTYILFKGLTAAQLGAVTAIMVAARIFDALNDPLMGNIIESTRTRFGKFKPWLVMTIVPYAFMLASYFLYKKKYKLDEEEYQRICEEIAARDKIGA